VVCAGKFAARSPDQLFAKRRAQGGSRCRRFQCTAVASPSGLPSCVSSRVENPLRGQIGLAPRHQRWRLSGSVEPTVFPIPVLRLASRRWHHVRQTAGDSHFMQDGISRFDQRYVLIPGSWCFATNLDLAFRPVSDAFELVSHENHSDLCCHQF